MIGHITTVLRELGQVPSDQHPRYNVVITKGASYVVEAYVGGGVFLHIKAAEVGPESMRACFESTERARALFADLIPKPVACRRIQSWEVFVSEGVYFEPLRREQLLSSGRAFRSVIELLARARQDATTPDVNVPHSGFLTTDVLGRVRGANLEASLEPWLGQGLLSQMDRLPPVRQHGDLILNNLGLRKTGLVVFDWEDFGRLTLPGVDLLTLLLSLTGFDAGRLRSIMESPVGGAGEYEALIAGGCRALTLDPALFRRLIPLYLTEFLYLKYEYASHIQQRVAAIIRDVCR